MGSVYALLIGIDDYRAAPPLRGAVNDTAAALAYLRSRVEPGELSAVELHDGKATRQAVVEALRDHLGQAGDGDTALLWYSGHGSAGPLPRELWHLEPDGRLQTLVCADSRDGDVPDLYDKELSVLLDRPAAGGAHVAAVLDCCHSEGALRALSEEAGRVRSARSALAAPDPALLIPELRDGWSALPERSWLVGLTACRKDEVAAELRVRSEGMHGVFSWALLSALNQLGPGATYRELLAAARCTVENRLPAQVPQLTGDGPADRPFLGGRLRAPASGITMRHRGNRWEIDAGACHDVPPVAAGLARVAVAGSPDRTGRVVSVLTERSIVEPDGWTPDPARQYQVVFTQLPQPALTLAVDGDAETWRRAAAGSPWVRVADPAERDAPDLLVSEPRPGRARIRGTDGTVLAPDIADDDPVRRVHRTVQAGEHIARWRRVRAFTNPASSLAGGVRLEIVPALPGERRVPLDRPPLRPGDDGLVRLRYRWENGGWVAPTVFVRLHNTTGRTLYCVLLDLTARHRIHSGLFPGALIGPRLHGAALDGRPVQFSLPTGESVAAGARTCDWLKLIVAEEQFSARPFEQGSLDEASSRGVPGGFAMTRDAGPGPDDPYDWAASTLGVLTEVPK
ncbi:caspase family protein [Paractinoplanes globisporus]|uniref:Caspase family protein n=1 Tax=Paractinoplanes globisporus TaxID=113565 RepID=A0ABW6WB78_9ACTN|nr:caspase family protein [Actinoplanes globisporus]